jgi:hypothetical protein
MKRRHPATVNKKDLRCKVKRLQLPVRVFHIRIDHTIAASFPFSRAAARGLREDRHTLQLPDRTGPLSVVCGQKSVAVLNQQLAIPCCALTVPIGNIELNENMYPSSISQSGA